MDYLKESLPPQTFHKVSYVILIGWFAIGAICLGIYGDTENSESRFDFHCGGAKSEYTSLVRGNCFELYEGQYNKYSVPIYIFVVLNFFFIGLVCGIYSTIVSPIVDVNLSSARNDGDPEAHSGDQENAFFGGKELFFCYLGQLFARLVFRLLFVVIQTQVLYPLDFPSSFSCYLTPGGNQARNSTGVIQNSTSILHECHNQRATRKNYWMKALFGMNLFFLIVIAIEALVIFGRACRDKSFMKNSKFVKDYLNPFHGKRRLSKFIENTKEKIKKDTHRPPQLRSPFPSTPGEGQPPKHLTLDRIYTNLVVVPNRATYDFTGEVFHHVIDSLLSLLSSSHGVLSGQNAVDSQGALAPSPSSINQQAHRKREGQKLKLKWGRESRGARETVVKMLWTHMAQAPSISSIYPQAYRKREGQKLKLKGEGESRGARGDRLDVVIAIFQPWSSETNSDVIATWCSSLSLDDDAPESVLHGATTFTGTLCREACAHCSISDVLVFPSTVAMVILIRSHRAHCVPLKTTGQLGVTTATDYAAPSVLRYSATDVEGIK
ncbi:hypothetical protein AWC38_SpisGene21580 [Stylophora pistillata]|uniref:Uncharacterized protein n=1 Tax=Stylophora pistillata TaxID=50429 RepID=A0A2B4RCR0_STYPI|nr:hypothetical protein AWC38_SpisGene21580 [Stylophora pistillata]